MNWLIKAAGNFIDLGEFQVKFVDIDSDYLSMLATQYTDGIYNTEAELKSPVIYKMSAIKNDNGIEAIEVYIPEQTAKFVCTVSSKEYADETETFEVELDIKQVSETIEINKNVNDGYLGLGSITIFQDHTELNF